MSVAYCHLREGGLPELTHCDDLLVRGMMKRCGLKSGREGSRDLESCYSDLVVSRLRLSYRPRLPDTKEKHFKATHNCVKEPVVIAYVASY